MRALSQAASACARPRRRSDRVALLNKCTEVINFWQDEAAKHSVAEAQEKFGDCKFIGC